MSKIDTAYLEKFRSVNRGRSEKFSNILGVSAGVFAGRESES